MRVEARGSIATRVGAVRIGALGLTTAVALSIALASPAPADGRWVVRGAGWGHGVGMSQYGARGYAAHGRGWGWILRHYYVHTRIGNTRGSAVRVLLDSGEASLRFGNAGRACGRSLNPDRRYRFDRSGSNVILRARHGKKLKSCGGTGTAKGPKAVHLFGKGRYRGKLIAKARSNGLMAINEVPLEGYVKGVVPNEVPSSWPAAALRAQATAARSYGLATRKSGAFDHYDDTRSQVYEGKGSETKATNRAAAATDGKVVKNGDRIAVTYFFSTSGGRTENKEFGFVGSDPSPYLKSVNDPYDGASPYHRWRARFRQGEMESRLSGLFSGNLRKIDVTKRGRSPRVVRARVVGSGGSSSVTGPTLQSRLGLRSTWMRFKKR